ncbi:caspase, EACC1-associated type [Nocardia sp. bgisy134]|uniref:caspase, EACC1-associated type n=1 Tax=Nocardia sp. bgisy134 TaxID=3413789 RepID=UPI003D738D37
MNRNGWRATLIGVSRYTNPELPDIPAAANNVADLAELLTAPTGGALAADHCTVLHDPSDAVPVGAAIRAAAKQASDVLILYYAGHGVLDSRGQLHLALPASNRDHIEWNGIPFDRLRREFSVSPARARILILDCCFSGRAFEAMSATSTLVEGQVDIHGTYTIASSARNEPSEAPEGHRHTAFTAALLDAARDTSRTLDQLYVELDRNLFRKGYPRPHRRSVDIAGGLRLFIPPVHRPPIAGIATMPSIETDVSHRAELESWYRAAEGGDTDAMYNLAVMFDKTRNFDDAVAWYQRAAESGHPDAMHNLAIRLRYRGQVPEAATWWQRAGHRTPQGPSEKLRGPVVLGQSRSAESEARSEDVPPRELSTSRRVMLISLGRWVDDSASWDETPWGGSIHTRSGHGFFDGMADSQLLDSARVFWKFNPESPRWRDIEYAVVAHAGITRAVIRIDRYIGPFEGRYGLQGRLVDDPELTAELVGKTVPRRQNPITTWN